jgi:hypothetical protein
MELNSLLTKYNLIHTVNSATGIWDGFSSATDNIVT